jgi:hypothetical protein
LIKEGDNYTQFCNKQTMMSKYLGFDRIETIS